MSKIYAKDSFDRFGDDLCELLVSYLSFDDRFRCEGLSKQFQRTVFTSVLVIDVNQRSIKRLLSAEYFNLKHLMAIAKKCPNIQIIDCQHMPIDNTYVKTLIQTLRDYCHRFSDIYCTLYCFRDDKYYEMLAPMVTMVNRSLPMDRLHLTNCHRLSHLRCHCMSDIFVGETQILVTNLHSIAFSAFGVDSGFTRQMMAIFVANNHKLKSLRLIVITEKTQQFVIEFVDQLRELRELSLDFPYERTEPFFLSKIGQNCKHLAKFSFYLRSKSNDVIFRTLQSLQHFRGLKRLFLSITSLDMSGPEDINCQMMSLLKNCRRLTHFKLYLWGLTANWTRIDHYLPRLRHLVIDANNGWIDIKYFDDISRLTALQTLDIQSTLKINVNDNEFNELMFRCPKLECIKVRDSCGLRVFNRY